MQSMKEILFKKITWSYPDLAKHKIETLILEFTWASEEFSLKYSDKIESCICNT